MNPKVDDIPEKYARQIDGIKLIVMGGVKKGGSGCICPESVLLRTLVTHMVLLRDEVVVMDMEAGIEHLGRATAQGVDRLIIVVEPGRRSIETAMHVKELAEDLGLKKVAMVGNKIRSASDEEFLKKNLPDLPILGFIPFDDKIIEADLDGRPPYEAVPALLEVAREPLPDRVTRKREKGKRELTTGRHRGHRGGAPEAESSSDLPSSICASVVKAFRLFRSFPLLPLVVFSPILKHAMPAQLRPTSPAA